VGLGVIAPGAYAAGEDATCMAGQKIAPHYDGKSQSYFSNLSQEEPEPSRGSSSLGGLHFQELPLVEGQMQAQRGAPVGGRDVLRAPGPPFAGFSAGARGGAG